LSEIGDDDIDNISMALDHNNNWHLVYQQPDGGIKYLNSSSDQDVLFADAYTPSVDIDSTGAAHVMFVNSTWLGSNIQNQVLYMNKMILMR